MLRCFFFFRGGERTILREKAGDLRVFVQKRHLPFEEVKARKDKVLVQLRLIQARGWVVACWRLCDLRAGRILRGGVQVAVLTALCTNGGGLVAVGVVVSLALTGLHRGGPVGVFEHIAWSHLWENIEEKLEVETSHRSPAADTGRDIKLETVTSCRPVSYTALTNYRTGLAK